MDLTEQESPIQANLELDSEDDSAEVFGPVSSQSIDAIDDVEDELLFFELFDGKHASLTLRDGFTD